MLSDHKMVRLAFRFAAMYHDDQWRVPPGSDSPTEPYIFHPVRVASLVEGYVPKAAAVLHDVIEDTPATMTDLIGFPRLVRETVEVLTHREGEKYADYIGRVSEHPVASYVKLADLADNLRDQPAESRQRSRYERAAGAIVRKAPYSGDGFIIRDPLSAMDGARDRALDYIAMFEPEDRAEGSAHAGA